MTALEAEAAQLRRLFPATENMLYLDAAYQTPLSVPVRAELEAFYESALNAAGPKEKWLERVDEVRARLAHFLGASPDEIAFTKNTSEGLNICSNGSRWEPGDNVLLAEEDHPNNVYAWLAKRSDGLDVRLVPADKAWLDAETFAPYHDSRTRLISLSHVMFHSGQRNDIESIISFARAHGTGVVVDAMQSTGVLPMNVATLGATAVVSGSHKGLLTPHGLGFLYTPSNNDLISPTYVGAAGVANLRPDLFVDGGQIELHVGARRFELGNFNIAAIHALGAAIELLEDIGVAKIEDHVLGLGDQLIANCDELGVGLVGPREREHRSHIYVLNLTAPQWREFFVDRRVRVSAVRGGIRVSFGLYNNSHDVDRFAEHLRDGLRSLKTV